MGKGLSAYQKAILDLLRERGSMNVLELAWVVYALRVKERGKDPLSLQYSGVSEIPHVQALYRLMRSLERRGLVGRLLHRRPTRWYYLTWQEDKPAISFGKDGGEVSDYNLMMDRRGRFEFTSKGQKWIIKQS